MYCPKCGFPAAERSTFRLKCGTSLQPQPSQSDVSPDSAKFCGVCGTRVQAGEVTCLKCGARIGATVEPAEPRGRLPRFVVYGGLLLLLLSARVDGFFVVRAWRWSQDLVKHYASGTTALWKGGQC